MVFDQFFNLVYFALESPDTLTKCVSYAFFSAVKSASKNNSIDGKKKSENICIHQNHDGLASLCLVKQSRLNIDKNMKDYPHFVVQKCFPSITTKQKRLN